MELGYFKKKQILKNKNLLDLTPICIVAFKEGDDKIITLHAPRFKKNWISNLLAGNKEGVAFIKLDNFGTSTWLLIDGERNIHQIANELVRVYGEQINPVYERLATYFSQLYKNKYITWSEKAMEDFSKYYKLTEYKKILLNYTTCDTFGDKENKILHGIQKSANFIEKLLSDDITFMQTMSYNNSYKDNIDVMILWVK